MQQQQQTRTVQVTQLSDLATQREIHEFFSFSGEIESIQIQRDHGQSKTAFVTFKDSKALEIALLLSGATLVDQIVTISAVENYVVKSQMQEVRMLESVNCGAPENASLNSEEKAGTSTNGRVYVNRAQDVVTSMLQKGSAIGQDAMSKAKAFDEKHRLTASASEKVISFDKRVRLTEKLTVGLSVVNEKVKSVDQRLQVSDKTMAAIFAAEKKLNDTGSAVKTSRYVTVGAAWLNGAFGKVAKAGQAAGTKTREKFHLAVSNLAAKSGNVILRYEGEIQLHGVQDDFLGAVIGTPKRNLQLSHKPKVWVAESNVNAHSFMNTFNNHVAQVVNLRTGVL